MVKLEARHERLFAFFFYLAASILLLGIGIGFRFFSEMPLERDSSFYFFGLLTVIAAIPLFWSQTDFRARLLTTSVEFAASVILGFVVLSPYLYYMLANVPTGEINSASIHSVDPLNVIVPTRLNLLLGRLFSNVSAKFSGNPPEQGAYLGLPLLLLVAYSVLTELSSREKTKPGFVLLHIMLAVVIVLSFGPSLHVLDRFHDSVWMPWRIFRKVPFLVQALPSRFSPYASLLASLAAAFAYAKIGRRATRYVAGIVVLSFLLPNPSFIYRGTVNVPAFFSDGLYKKYISKDETVLLLPPYDQFGTPAFFHAYSNFYFHIAQEIAGVPPMQVRKVLFLNDYTDPFRFHLYLSSPRCSS